MRQCVSGGPSGVGSPPPNSGEVAVASLHTYVFQDFRFQGLKLAACGRPWWSVDASRCRGSGPTPFTLSHHHAIACACIFLGIEVSGVCEKEHFLVINSFQVDDCLTYTLAKLMLKNRKTYLNCFNIVSVRNGSRRESR